MRIIRARLKPYGGTSEFISVKGRIKSLIRNNHGDVFNFVIDDGGIKSAKTYGPGEINPDLVGKEIAIIDDTEFAKFNEDGTIELTYGISEGALPRQHTVDQLKKVMKMSSKTDIGNRISDMEKQGANIQYIHNPINKGIESYEDFEKKNKKFIPSWNLKHLLSPFGKDKKSNK